MAASSVDEALSKLQAMLNSLRRLEIEELLEQFKYQHLPEELALVSKPYCELAVSLARDEKTNGQVVEALRYLLKAKDAAVRARVLSKEAVVE